MGFQRKSHQMTILEFVSDLGDDPKCLLFVVIGVCFCILCFSSCTAIKSLAPEPKKQHSRLAEQITAIDYALGSDTAEIELIKELILKYSPEGDTLEPGETLDTDQMITILKEADVPEEQIDRIRAASDSFPEDKKKW